MSAWLRSRLSLHRLAATILLAAGLVLRLRAYFAGRSLWLDEAMLALNLIRRDFAGLMLPLDYDQGAPLGFLLLQKGIILLLGSGELALRLVPLLAGCLALIIFAWLAFRLLPRAGALVALALFSFSPSLIFYSAEAKQYSLDVLLAVLGWAWFAAYLPSPLALTPTPLPQGEGDDSVFAQQGEGDDSVFARQGEGDDLAFARQGEGHDLAFARQGERRDSIFWVSLLFCFLFPFFSHPSIFVLAGVTLAGFGLQRTRRGVWFSLGAAAALGFGAAYWLNLRALAQNAFLLGYWREFFVPSGAALFPWLGEHLAGLLGRFNEAGLGLNLTPAWLNLLMAGVGAIWLLRKRFYFFTAGMLLPVAFTFVAAALGKYPFGGRMTLFLLPWAALLLGACAAAWGRALSRWGPNPARAGVWLLAGILLVGPVFLSAQRLVSPFLRENLHPALVALRVQRRPDDFVYIYPAAAPAFLYYAPRYGLTDFLAGDYVQGESLAAQTLTDLRTVNAPRMWVLFAHVWETQAENDEQTILTGLELAWRCKTNTRAPGTGVELVLCTRR